nr:PREDICTED: uncharacterized protein LOC100883596 isoform X1 [Megachile rotundata]XP_012146274.1 PREDICTED: uncharacterized protein LOC100883596 isoform X1 [Megachile rotundata]
MPVSKLYKKRVNLYRKRKRNPSISDDDDAINDELLEEIDRSVKYTDKKAETCIQNTITKDTLNTPNDNKKHRSPRHSVTFNNISNEENTNVKYSKKDTKAKNDSQNSIISVRKLEELCKTPKKNIVSDDLNAGSVKKENVNSPDVFSPLISGISMMEWNSQTIKSLLETPISSKKGKYNLSSNTPSSRKKRKSSLNLSDYDQLSDTFKSDLSNNVLPDMEPIDMLHDLNSVMDFEDIKVPADIFTSTVNSTMNNEYNVEMSKDPLVDPLFIENQEECKTVDEDVDHKNKIHVRRTRSASKASLQLNGNKELTEELKVKDKDTYDLKDILGELDIDLETETESDKIPKEAIKKLYNLKVQLIHVVPNQHKIEQRAASRGISKTERLQFLKYGPIKKGVFTPNEDKVILHNWKKFCEVHSWDPKHVKPFICLKNNKSFYMRSKEQRINFLQFLANGLPWRSLFSVYNRFKYLQFNRDKNYKRYSLDEDYKILSYMKNKQPKNNRNSGFCELARELGRSHHSIWLRYQLLRKIEKDKEKKPLKDIEWTLPLIAKFIECLMDITLCDELIDLKDATIPKVIWQKLEEKLNIEQNVLKMYWIHQLHMQLFCPEPIYLNDIKIKLIEYIYTKGIAHTREIIWPDVAKHFDGITTIFLCRTFYYLVAEAGIKLATKNFHRINKYLYKERIAEIQNELTDKFLPRLSYDNGEVKVVDMDLSEY